MVQYKLHYFNFRARAELSRLVFAQAGVAYQDVRVEFTDWPAMKKDMPFGQLPVLEVDGVQYCQSIPIARYLAQKHGLGGGSSAEELLFADMVVACCEDISQACIDILFKGDEDKKPAEIKKLKDEKLPNMMKQMKGLLNVKKGDFLCGSKVSWADLAFLVAVDWLAVHNLEIPECCKEMRDLHARVCALPNVKAWLQKRPKTDK